MLDGLPLHPAHQGRQGDGHICKHKQGEGDGVQQLFGGGGVDLVPLGDGGDHAVHEQSHIEAEHRVGHELHRHSQHLPGLQRRQQQTAHRADAVEQQGRQSQQHAGGNGHQHVIAGEPAPAGETAAHQREHIVGVHLVKTLGPAKPLGPGLGEAGGLLVVDHSAVAVADALAADGAVNRKLDVLGEQMEGPAAIFLDHLAGQQETGAGDGAVGAQQLTGEVEEPALAQKPQGIAGGDPVGAEVFGVAVAGDGAVLAAGEGVVHLGDEVGVHQVVGVEYKEAGVLAELIRLDQLTEEIVHGVALAHLHLVEPLVDGGAGLPGDAGGVVGAVVGHHIDVQQLAGIFLLAQAGDQLADHPGLVAGADDDAVAVEGAGHLFVLPAAVHQAVYQKEQLVGVGGREQNRQSGIKQLDHVQHTICLLEKITDIFLSGYKNCTNTQFDFW